MRKGRIHTKSEVDRILNDIRGLMQQNVPDSQIRYTLGLELRQYQRFAKIINLQNQEIWRELVKGEIATELLKLRSSLEATYLVLNDIWKKPGLDTQELLAVLRSKDMVRSDICSLLVEGTEMITNMEQEQQQVKNHKSQSSIMMQNQPHP